MNKIVFKSIIEAIIPIVLGLGVVYYINSVGVQFPGFILAHLILLIMINWFFWIFKFAMFQFSTYFKQGLPQMLALGFSNFAYLFFLYITYFAALGGKIGWGQPLTYGMVVELFPILPTMFWGLPLVSWIKWGLAILFFSVFFVLVLLSYYNSKRNLLFFNYLTETVFVKPKLKPLLGLFVIASIGFLVLKFQRITTALFAREELISRMIIPSKNIAYSNWLNSFDALADREKNNYSPSSLPKKKNVILIVVDDLRADKLGVYNKDYQFLTPFLNEMEKKHQLSKIDNFYSSCADTFCGILSILSSHKRENMSRNDLKINNLLSSMGYESKFVISSDHSSWYGLRDLYGKDVDYYFDGSMTEDLMNSANDQIVVDKLLQLEKNPKKAQFFYLHLMSPHPLGAKNERYKVFKPNKFGEGFDWFFGNQTKGAQTTKSDSMLVSNNYLNGIYQLDRYLKTIYSIFSKKGYLKDALFIVTSDHGEGLSEHESFGHGKNLYEESIKVPLIFLGNQEQLPIDNRLAYHIDIAPTILDFLHVQKPSTWEGVSLLKKMDRPNYSFHQLGGTYALIYQDKQSFYKYVFNKNTKEEFLFDLKHDSKEITNLALSKNMLPLIVKFKNKLFKEFNTL